MTDLFPRIDTTPFRNVARDAARFLQKGRQELARGAQTMSTGASQAASAVPVRIEVGKRTRRPALPMVLVALAAAAVGALVAWVLDPQLGRSRRAVTIDRVAGATRRLGRWSARRGRWLSATVAGTRDRVQHASDAAEPLDEVALAHKVESILFRDPAIEKGNINVNAESDVVFLRGVVTDQGQAREIGSRVERIEGVRSVVNLLRARTESPIEAGAASAR